MSSELAQARERLYSKHEVSYVPTYAVSGPAAPSAETLEVIVSEKTDRIDRKGTIARIDGIKGMGVETLTDQRALVEDLRSTLGVAAHVSGLLKEKPTRSLAHAAASTLQASNSLMTALATRCSLANPPKDIDVRQNEQGDLVYRCYHSPVHEWDLSGRLR
jgi:hypothetical protein